MIFIWKESQLTTYQTEHQLVKIDGQTDRQTAYTTLAYCAVKTYQMNYNNILKHTIVDSQSEVGASSINNIHCTTLVDTSITAVHSFQLHQLTLYCYPFTHHADYVLMN